MLSQKWSQAFVEYYNHHIYPEVTVSAGWWIFKPLGIYYGYSAVKWKIQYSTVNLHTEERKYHWFTHAGTVRTFYSAILAMTYSKDWLDLLYNLGESHFSYILLCLAWNRSCFWLFPLVSLPLWNVWLCPQWHRQFCASVSPLSMPTYRQPHFPVSLACLLELCMMSDSFWYWHSCSSGSSVSKALLMT